MISETRCSMCRTYLDREDLFCSNCGTENPMGIDADGFAIEPVRSGTHQQASVMSFRCNGCGASMSYDASAKTLRCPFCGSEQMTERQDARTLRPRGIVPFAVDRSNVEQSLRRWLSQGFWNPSDTAQRSVISKVTPVYVPFWVFSASTETAWTGDSSAVPMGARGTWRPMAGTDSNRYDGVLVGASGILTPIEVEEIAPFDVSQAVGPDQIDLTNVIVEEFRVTRRDARMRAAALVERYEAHHATKHIPGSARQVQVNVRVQDMNSVPLLLPVWIMVYHYNKQAFRVLVNGQTGEVYGGKPFSYTKLTAVVAIMFLVILLFIVVVALAGVMR